MTNLERWSVYMKDVPSPDIFIEWGFYSLISGALQRRVWVDSGAPVYPNHYIVLTAPPGVGKGNVLNAVKDFLGHHVSGAKTISEAERLAGAKPQEGTKLFSLAADSTTFESFVLETSRSSTHIEVPKQLAERVGVRVYSYAPMHFILDEATSIFHKDAQSLTTFLLTTWSCGNYERKTKNKGNECIRNTCVSLLAGTTPEELQSLARTNIITSGFTARTMFVYANHERFRMSIIPPHTAEQTAARGELLDYLKMLSTVILPVKFGDKAMNLFSAWWADESRVRVNRNQKLVNYYVRKNVHAMKLALTMHFADPDWNDELKAETLERAIAKLDETEKHMHLALEMPGRNQLATVGSEIVNYLRREGPTDFTKLLVEFFRDVTDDELSYTLQSLQQQGRVFYHAENRKYYTK